MKCTMYLHFVQNCKGLGEVLLELVQGLAPEPPLAQGQGPEGSVPLGPEVAGDAEGDSIMGSPWVNEL